MISPSNRVASSTAKEVLPTPVGPATIIGVLLLRMATLAAPLVDGLRAADDQLATHVVFIVQLGDRALRFVDGLHLDEGEALGFVRMLVRNDLYVLDRSDPAEELEEIALRRLKRQVAYVNARGGNLDNLRFSESSGTDGPLGFGGVAIAPVRLFQRSLRRRSLGTLSQKEGGYPLPPGFFLGQRNGRFLSVAGAGSSAATLSRGVGPAGGCVFG